jgi:hypothetical protein
VEHLGSVWPLPRLLAEVGVGGHPVCRRVHVSSCCMAARREGRTAQCAQHMRSRCARTNAIKTSCEKGKARGRTCGRRTRIVLSHHSRRKIRAITLNIRSERIDPWIVISWRGPTYRLLLR